MFTKTVILILLGSAIVPTSLAQTDQDGTFDKIKGWYSNGVGNVQNACVSTANTITDYYEKIKANAVYAAELGEDALVYLKEKGVEIKDATLIQIKAAKDQAEIRIEKLKNSVNETARAIAHETKKIIEQTKKTIAQIEEASNKKQNEEVNKSRAYYSTNDE